MARRLIKTKTDLRYFLDQDKKALVINNRVRPKLFGDEIWKYQRLLRKTEYHHNNLTKNPVNKLLYFFYKLRQHYLGIRLGYTIPVNCFGPGLSIAHIGTVVINSKATIGSNCRIHVDVNIGVRKGKAPKLGDNVYIGPGAKIFGGIEIASNVKIGANSVVNKSVFTSNVTLAGIPAKVKKLL